MRFSRAATPDTPLELSTKMMLPDLSGSSDRLILYRGFFLWSLSSRGKGCCIKPGSGTISEQLHPGILIVLLENVIKLSFGRKLSSFPVHTTPPKRQLPMGKFLCSCVERCLSILDLYILCVQPYDMSMPRTFIEVLLQSLQIIGFALGFSPDLR